MISPWKYVVPLGQVHQNQVILLRQSISGYSLSVVHDIRSVAMNGIFVGLMTSRVIFPFSPPRAREGRVRVRSSRGLSAGTN